MVAAASNPGQAAFGSVNPGVTASAGCAAHTLSDDFEDGTVDVRWGVATAACCGLEESVGVLQLTSDGTGGVVALTSSGGYDFRTDDVTVRVVSGPSASSSVEASLIVRFDNRNFVELRLDLSDVVARVVLDGSPTTNKILRDLASPGVYLRIREAAGMVVFEVSPDKQTWSMVDTVPDPFPLDDVKVRLQLGSGVAANAPDQVTFDDLNVP